MKTEIIAMILAGGQGTRLGKFTKNLRCLLVESTESSILFFPTVPIHT